MQWHIDFISNLFKHIFKSVAHFCFKTKARGKTTSKLFF